MRMCVRTQHGEAVLESAVTETRVHAAAERVNYTDGHAQRGFPGGLGVQHALGVLRRLQKLDVPPDRDVLRRERGR